MSTMKVLLSLTILLASGIFDFGANAAAVIVKRGDLPEKILAEVNSVRAGTAKFFNISNMNKLTWSDELADEAKKAPRNCQELKDGANYRYSILEKHSRGKSISKGDLTSDAHMLPTQTEIGCDYDFSCVTLDGKWEGLCYVGPRMLPVKSDFKDGTPGSQCGDFKSEGGLCIVPPKKASKSSTDGAASLVILISCLIRCFCFS